jgi:hypothetical protein
VTHFNVAEGHKRFRGTSISGQKLEAADVPETYVYFLPNHPSERQEHLKLDIQALRDE